MRLAPHVVCSSPCLMRTHAHTYSAMQYSNGHINAHYLDLFARNPLGHPLCTSGAQTVSLLFLRQPHPPVWEAGPQYNVRKQRGSSMAPPSPPPPHPFPFIIINAKRGVSLFLLLLYMFSNHSGMRAGTNEYERVPIRN